MITQTTHHPMWLTCQWLPKYQERKGRSTRKSPVLFLYKSILFNLSAIFYDYKINIYILQIKYRKMTGEEYHS